MKGKPPTTAEISAELGVSKSTVSRALKNDPRISARMRAKVLSMADKLGYAPNAIAQSLATRSSQIIGFIGSEEENYWYQENIQKLAASLSAANMQLMVFQVSSGGEVMDVVPAMIKYRLAGCIVIPTVKISIDTVETLDKYNVTVVLLNRGLPGTVACSIQCDQVAGAVQLAKLLTEAGHERIAFVAGSETPTAAARERGFVDGLGEAGQRLFARINGDYTFEGAYEATKELLAKRTQPDAIFAANDLMAFGVLDALRDLSLRVPEDISVVGFDNSRIGAWPAYQLTTISQPIDYMFSRAIELITDRNPSSGVPPENIFVDGKLVIRRSARTGQPRAF
jgi:LacI family transcriptional regulator